MEDRRQVRDQRLARETAAAEKAADQPGTRAGATEMDAAQAAVRREDDHVTAQDGRQVEVAAQQVLVIAREQHDLSSGELERLHTLETHPELALNDVVIEDQ